MLPADSSCISDDFDIHLYRSKHRSSPTTPLYLKHAQENMSIALRNTSWPSAVIPNDSRDLIGRFFTLVDQKSVQANKELGYEVFSSNGIMIAATGRAEGSQGKNFSTYIVFRFSDKSKLLKSRGSMLGTSLPLASMRL